MDIGNAIPIEENGVNNLETNNNQKLTPFVFIICIVAATAGFIFGYDVGVSGGVTTMEPFLEKFFPFVLKRMAEAKQSQYCMFESQLVTIFTSSLYLAGLVSSLIAGRVGTTAGRKGCMIIGGFVFFLGSVCSALAANILLLIIGRVLLGFGVGFTNQAAPIYLSEMAPPKWRGAFSTGFELFLNLGVLIASIINYFVARLGDYGWRISLGAAAVPAAIMAVGAFFIPDTPSSLIQRGKVDEARRSLNKVRVASVHTEFELKELTKHCEAIKATNRDPYKMIFERHYRSHLVLAIAIPSFQQLTGINIIAFYAPVLFRSIGFGSDGALIGAIILGSVNITSTMVSTFAVDRFGRRVLLIQAGFQIFVSQVIVGVLLAYKVEDYGPPLSKNWGIVVLLLCCAITAAFAWSWGPLTFLIPSEILPMEIRPAGQGICIAFNFLVTFIFAQTFTTMFCQLKYGVFLFHAALVVMMTIFVILLVPETKGIPLESMDEVWKKHWYWRRFVDSRSSNQYETNQNLSL